MQVNEIPIVTLQKVNFNKKTQNILLSSALANTFLAVIAIMLHHNNLINTDLLPILLVVTSAILFATLFITKHLYPIIHQEISELVRDVFRFHERIRVVRNNVTVVENFSINEEDIDRLKTTLKINNSSKYLKTKKLEKIILTEMFAKYYSTIISRIYQNNFIVPNQNIFVVSGTSQYFELAKEILNLGITPKQVFHETDNNSFAIIIDDIEDANLLQIAQDKKFLSCKTNDLIGIIEQIKIH